MSTTTRISRADRLGRSIGRGWCAFRRGELRLSNCLASKGVPVAGVTLVFWVVKLSLLGLLLYFAFCLAALLLLAVLWLAGTSPVDDRFTQQDELRNGEAGFGLYSSNGQRIDPHDPNDPFNN
ncbi:DUF3742 family protein [Pseudomonas sp. CBSPBW29]|uniref:DUF3742 family protein n=1 Tax=Pseudomonas sp. CBS TaxID=2971912 RepID=UPI0021AC0889|nr:DUF3742 family protein [Pseudomonas sp. CBS]WEL43531.1 DUF3742 family protein [Pseudomonas sp. CBSPBW29]WEL64600.1 DUF3742 family protein [Pseudomonas sp. CBSPGW29]WEL68067.1 DUF3742 family protein [Pseudomonas sp. CBSPCGW29]WEL75089.1 DUF3742 family protein [Pseudomonas sp. CBSPAW29]WEL80665.1 DUF3742 family protein [Pseudomonas sp. CBSPCAW29]WEL89180.1 DUF3742 family protein [Pseudomonas sp. CBSPCBW29]